jgi:tetratricopeptide (TPR) repeat protein
MAKQKRTPGEGPQRRRPSPPVPGELSLSDWRAVEASLPRIASDNLGSSALLAQAQAIIYDAFDADFERQVPLARAALEVSPDCADAYLVLAEHASNLDEALDLYRQGVEAGQRAIGAAAFRQHEGAFWQFFETRSYLRARLGWAQCLWNSNQYDEAVEHFREILRLNPQDQQGVRYLLAAALMDLGRNDELGQLLDRYPDDRRTDWLFNVALLAYRRESDSPRARQSLLAAVEQNRYVPEYLLDFTRMPPDLPDDAPPGSPEEAVCAAARLRLAWRTTPQAIAWMRKVLQVPILPPPVTRTPDWRRLQRFLGELPQARDEIWQIDSRQFAEKIEIEGASGRPWLIVVADQSHGAFLAIEAGEGKPTPGDVWHHLVEAMLKPRVGDPRRPQKILVRLKSYQKAWQKKLAQLGVACDVGEPLDLVELAVAQTRVAQAADRRDPNTSPHGADDPTDPRALPQEIGEAWQADLRRLLGWVEEGGEVLRPYGVIVAQSEGEQVLAYDLAVHAAPSDWLWQTVARAIRRPLRGPPHRPGLIEVASEEHRAALQPHLEPWGIRCAVAARLDPLDVICEEMSRSLNRPVTMTAMVDVPGMSRERIAAFFAAAADYYRRMPWRGVSGNVPIEVRCDKFQSGPWHAVVLGQSGITLGLALYEGLENVEAVLSGEASEAEQARRASAISVTFGEAFEMPIRDLDAAERYRWSLASPDAYPCAMRVNPGRAVRPPLAWELELLEGCLRVIPDFIAEEVWESVRIVPVASGELTLQLSWMSESED